MKKKVKYTLLHSRQWAFFYQCSYIYNGRDIKNELGEIILKKGNILRFQEFNKVERIIYRYIDLEEIGND